jgi:outer membrane protein OmpA-like peptidoglycan-associated protein
MRFVRTVLLAAAVVGTVAVAPPARAESGKFNLHLDVGAMFPPVGFAGNIGFDWQFRPGFAIDVIMGGGYLATAGDLKADFGLFQTAVGVRFRFLDNKEGYLNEKGGDALGNLYLVPRIGIMVNDIGGAFTFDAQLGYEWSVVKPMQLGVFIRPGFAAGPLTTAPVIPYVIAGLNFSFELGHSPPLDSDHDDLPDEREQWKYHTSAHNPDSDADGLKDGEEVKVYHTNPLDRDTDKGGSSDGWEVANHREPVQTPADDDLDQDKVPDEIDACPNTPPNTEVDSRGCVVIRQAIVLEGITFQYNSAVIQPQSEQTLTGALQILRDNPNVRVEIGGHTDDMGKPDYNMRLSSARAASVQGWLVAHGIPESQLTVRGYGATKPRAPNDSEAHRAKNRRIEFTRIDQQ